MGTEGYALMAAIFGQANAGHRPQLPMLAVRRQMGLPPYARCGEPGLEDVRWRGPAERPPAALQLQAPYDLEARSSTQRDPPWVGSKAPLREPGDAGDPELITQAITTPATTPACVVGPAMQQD
jgi:hypothetical protein